MLNDTQLNIEPAIAIALNVIIVLNMFAVSLHLRISDFKVVYKNPKTAMLGLSSQFLLLPLVTLVFTLMLPLDPTVALALILVSCVPGGNLSNVFTFLARGNLPVSVALTATGFPIAAFLTPINFALYSNLHPEVSLIVSSVKIDPISFAGIIVLNILLPLVLGCWIGTRFKNFYKTVEPFISGFALLSIGLTIILIFKDNLHIPFEVSQNYIAYTVAHHAVVISCAYVFSALFKLSERDKRTISIETGIQNAPLAIILLLTFIPTVSSAALAIAFWGAWQILATFVLALVWRVRAPSGTMSLE